MKNKSVYLAKYQKIENDFFYHLESELAGDLLFYCVTGSLARKSIKPNWSDIDILIVFANYSEKIFNVLSSALDNNKSGVKIGTTFYSIDEFTAKNIFKDPKTIYSLELIKSGVYNPRKCCNIVIDEIDKLVDPDFSNWSSIISFTMLLHEYKRALLPCGDIDEKKVYKLLNTLLKILLRRKGIVALSYENVLNEAKNNLSGFNFNLVSPEDITRDKESVNKRKKEYIKILNWIKKYKYA